MKIRFKDEQSRQEFKNLGGYVNIIVEKTIGSGSHEVVLCDRDAFGKFWYLSKDGKPITIDDYYAFIIDSEWCYFEWIDDKPSIKSLWDIAQQKKAEYDKAMTEYNKAVMEKLDESTI